MDSAEIEKLFEPIEPEEKDFPFILPRKINEKIPIVKYKSPILQASVKRSKPYCRMIIGKSFYQALWILSGFIQKVPKFLVEVMNRSIMTLTKRNLNLSFIYIQGIITSKKNVVKKIGYHAKGRGSHRIRHWVDFTFHFGRRNIKDFFKELVIGVNHTNLAHIIRQKIQQEEINYEDIKALQWVLTSKGRQQQKLMIKRKALYKYVRFKRANIKVGLKFLIEKEAEIEGVNFMRQWGYLFDEMSSVGNDHQSRKSLYEQRTKEA